MNEVRTFRAGSMQEALAIVRRELGVEAVILHSRQVTQKRLLPFLKPKEEVEVTAGTGIGVRTVVARPQTAPVAAASVSTASPSGLVGSAGPATRSAPPAEPDTPLSKAARLAQELERRNSDKARLEQSLKALEQQARARQKSHATPVRRTGAPQPGDVHEPQHLEPSTLAGGANPSAAPVSEFGGLASSRSRTVNAGPQIRGTSTTGDPNSVPAIPAAPTQVSSATPDPTSQQAPPNQAATLQAAAAQRSLGEVPSEISGRLDALQKMVESLTRTAHFRGKEEVPPELFEIYTRLIDADIEDDLARELIFSLRQNCSTDQLQDAAASNALMTALVEKDIRIANPIRPQSGRRKVVALVGPTGVGKTTTIAKLAANFRLRDGVKMGLVTVDTYRIAAVEQLRTYAEIIDLPMKVVTSPQDMRRALDELSGLDLVLIDTAGRSPRDELKIQELKQMLAEASVDEVHLVMSLTASVKSIRMTCDQFKAVNPTALVLTKLDEAAGMGSLLSVAREVRLPFSYLTTGQDVPEDIEPAHASRIARLVLGVDRLFV